MAGKNAGWILIGIAIVIGALRLLDVIDNSTTAVLSMFFIIIAGGASKRFKKKEDDAKAPEETS